VGRIFLVRHGQVEWNARNSYIGATDLPLDATGLEQARLLADYLLHKEIVRVYCSSLLRARQTADIIGTRLNVPVIPCSELRELNYGVWEGIPESEVSQRYPDLYSKWLVEPLKVQIPEGELLSDFKDRVLTAFYNIAMEHCENNVVIVAHKTTNRVIIASILGVDINRYRQIGQNNACINTIYVREDGSLSVECINEVCHLTSCPPGKRS
jgi:broad specificity phosphatase PhoE